MSTLGGKFSANVKTFIEAVFKWSLSATPFWLLFDSFGDSFEIHHRRVGVFVCVAWDSCTVNVKVLHTKYTCDDLIRIHFKFSSKTCVNSVILWIFCMILSVKKKRGIFGDTRFPTGQQQYGAAWWVIMGMLGRLKASWIPPGMFWL